MEKKEYKIGEEFNYNGRTLKCVESDGCDGCKIGDCSTYFCGGSCRSDGKYVKYIEVDLSIETETSKSPTIDWDQRRYELAKAAMQGMLGCCSYNKDINNNMLWAERIEDYELIKQSISIADEMINQLKQTATN